MKMKSELKDLLPEIDALAERWDDDGAFDELDAPQRGTNRTAAVPKPYLSRLAQCLSKIRIGWLPWAVAVGVLFFAFWSQSQIAARATALAEQRRDHAENVQAWQKEKQAVLRQNAEFMRTSVESGDLAAAVKALHSLRGFSENMETTEFDSEIEETRRDIAIAVLKETGYTQKSLTSLTEALPKSN